MITNLDNEMSSFKDRIINEQDKVSEVSYRAGYSGGGAAWWSLLMLLPMITLRVRI